MSDKFPNRVELFRSGYGYYSVNGLGHLLHKDGPESIKYISLEEHEAILKEARAKVWEEMASINKSTPPIQNLYLDKAREERQKQ